MKVKNILVSQPKPVDLDKSPYGELCKRFNLKIDFHKFIKIEEVTAQEFRQAKGTFQGHTAVILTSRHAVDHFFVLRKNCGMKFLILQNTFAFQNQRPIICKNMYNTGSVKYFMENRILLT